MGKALFNQRIKITYWYVDTDSPTGVIERAGSMNNAAIQAKQHILSEYGDDSLERYAVLINELSPATNPVRIEFKSLIHRPK